MIASLSSIWWRLLAVFQRGNITSIYQDTSDKAGELPHGIMDAVLTATSSASPFSQLLLFVYQLLGERLSFDPPVLITAAGFIWALSKLFYQAYSFIEYIVEHHLTCSICVTEDDQIYDFLMKFISRHPALRSSRQLMAETSYHGAWDNEDQSPAVLRAAGGDDHCSTNYCLNYSQHAAQNASQFTPALGQTGFWHKGRYFRLCRFKETFSDTDGWGPMKDLESINISCYGRSADPIKRLLEDSKALYWEEMSERTTIHRPRSKEMRRDYGVWQQVARRPVRPLQTVVLDSKRKHEILKDINEYLHPTTPWWYASRGIPLRRGYLFHGPPGTGKTSFSFALAGVFGIDIYVISLQDNSITEEDLNILFIKLPRRCVVLLEDIDSAGLCREGELSAGNKEDGAVKEEVSSITLGEKHEKKIEKAASDSESPHNEGHTIVGKSRRYGRGVAAQGENNTGGISLSGLLNAIDGVASHEGRVLIMTTNTPESLDEALVRPGRVDMQVEFTKATQLQIQELFLRMYEPPKSSAWDKPASAAGLCAEERSAAEHSELLSTIAREAYSVDVDAEQLTEIASQFAEHIPVEEFSPAEIQGFLLMRKKSPRKALEDVQAWVEATLKRKKNQSKIAIIQ